MQKPCSLLSRLSCRPKPPEAGSLSEAGSHAIVAGAGDNRVRLRAFAFLRSTSLVKPFIRCRENPRNPVLNLGSPGTIPSFES